MILTLAATLLLSAAPQDKALAPWTELGPAPLSNLDTGRVPAFAAHPTNPDLVYAAGADGGVWRVENDVWTALTSYQATTSVGALALAPSDPQVIYAGTGEANYANHSRYGLGVLKSTDAGDTWELLGGTELAGRCISRLVVHPSDADTVWAAVTRAGGFPELAAAKNHPGAMGDLGVFKSTDGGQSWAHLAGLPNLSATDLVLDVANPNVLYAGIGRIYGHASNGIYKTTDGGTNWTKLNSGLPSGTYGRVSIGIGTDDPTRLYALIVNPASSTGGGASTKGAYRSSNGGASWSSIGSFGNIQVSYGWYLSVVGVKPTNADVVTMAGLSLKYSSNGGSSWSTRTPPHVDLHALGWDAAGRLLSGDDGGLHRSSDDGGNWQSFAQGPGLIQLYAGLSSHPTDPDVFVGGFQDNGTGRRSASGWTRVFGGDGGWTQIHPTNPNIVFCEYQGTGNLFRSTNGGFSFSGSSSGISSGDRNCFLPPYLIERQNPARMLYATQRIYRSTNSGSSWAAISGDVTTGSGAVRCLAQAPSDPSIVYLATNDGLVRRSGNGGANWTTILSAHPGWPRVTRELSVHPSEPLTVYLATAVFGAEQVRRSTDGGSNWTSLDGNLPDVPVNVVEVLPNGTGQPEILFAGADNGLWVSMNGGVLWQRYGQGLPHTPVIDIHLQPRRGRIVVATQGRGVWSAELLLDASAQ